MIDPFFLFIGVIASGAGAAAYGLRMRDLVRRGRLHRRNQELIESGNLPILPEGRVACPECAEAILPAARRCPHCRSRISPQI